MAVRIPCKKCAKVEECLNFLRERKDEYDEERDLCEDYNSESIYMLGIKCDILNKYLFLDQVAFPSRNYHFMWWPQMKGISQENWINRRMGVYDFFSDLMTPSM